jgi:hypothetical protein
VQAVQVEIKAESMTLGADKDVYTLRFNCKPCDMSVVGAMKPGILLRISPPFALVYGLPTFHRRRPS